MRVTKASGTRNSFFIVDLREPKASEEFKKIFTNDRKKFVDKICNGKIGHWADGVLFLENPKNNNYDVEWDFYNNDGSSAEMCGNAARCATLFLLQNANQKSIKMMTLAGPVTGQLGVVPSVKMPEVKSQASQKRISVLGQQFIGYSINTGVPHFVILWENFFENDSKGREDLRRICSQIRFHPDFGTSGTNVTLIKVNTKNPIEVMTFERGVEGFTLSCGTGAVAAAIVAKFLRLVDLEIISIKVPGGDLLVELTDPARPILSGETQIEYILEFYGDK